MLGPNRAATAVEVARGIAARVTRAELVRAAVEAATQQTKFPPSVHWDPPSLAQGDAGQAVLCAYLQRCFPGEGWDYVAFDHLTRAVRAVEQHKMLSYSLFGGCSGVAFAGTLLAQDGTRYRRLLGTLDSAINPVVVDLAANLSRPTGGMPVGQFDLISGLSGMTAYLLMPGGGEPRRPVLEAALMGLASLAAEQNGVPRWYTPPRFMHDEVMARQFPLGNLNCGLAHGIPGPLAVMSLAVMAGHEVDGLRGAIRRLAGWLADNRHDDTAGPNWPTAVAVDAAGPMGGGHPATRTDTGRAAWCYGSPGVARALWLAGTALREHSWRELAVEAMSAVYRRPVADRRIDSPTFCHGVAGLLQVTLRFANDTGLPVFTDAAAALVDQVLQAYDPGRLMAIANIEPAGNLVDQPGLLDGATGVALVLLAAATDQDPAWDRMFALS